ncbi:hypothetical protein [Bradyrhizobium tropiciagri]|uniref:hypothetical protein n=1 Tax=Bradyrhizobium tropiciagri TaxID=312253 RepID=UPI0010098EFA|nr:hypothetical protein [Bradyrhizobium tropiciagri]
MQLVSSQWVGSTFRTRGGNGNCPARTSTGFTVVLVCENAAAGATELTDARLSAIASKPEVRNMTFSCAWSEVV